MSVGGSRESSRGKKNTGGKKSRRADVKGKSRRQDGRRGEALEMGDSCYITLLLSPLGKQGSTERVQFQTSEAHSCIFALYCAAYEFFCLLCCCFTLFYVA